jgi:transposase
VFPLLILEDVMPRRKPASSRPDPATAAVLQTLNPHAAGIDIGATELWGCVPPSAVASPLLAVPSVPTALPPHVRRFGAFTADLHAIAAWLRQCQVTTIARESTGVYWIPLYDLLEAEGFEVLLVDPRQVQRAPNRPKTDVHDCQWSPRLHRLGLLTAAFRPAEPIRVWRSSQRQRASLIEDAGRHVQRIEQALEQMHVQLPEVVSAITGLTGMGIIRAIVRGERDPQEFAQLRDHRCKESAATIARAWQGTWQVEHLFAFQQSLALYDYDHEQIRDCDRVIEDHLKGMA